MKECIGMLLIETAIVLAGSIGFSADMGGDIKEFLAFFVVMEIFVSLITIGGCLVAGAI